MTWRPYHEATKHSAESLRRWQHVLDWANMPDPFRHYEGVPVLDLPADPPAPGIATLELLQGADGHTAAADGPAFLSQLLFHAAAISASKRVPSTGYRYALRVNPSSGNLHPTEFHFFTRGLRQWPDGLYHYRPSSHMAEQRAIGNFEMKLAGSSAPIVFVITSIAWREAWKYRDRAYRYCLHDVGHAWQALALAAQAMGCSSFAAGIFRTTKWPSCAVSAKTSGRCSLFSSTATSIPLRDPDGGKPVWFGGAANKLSDEQIPYPSIDEMHAATKLNEWKGNGAVAGRTGAHRLRRDPAAFPCFIDSHLWRGRSNPALGARLRGWD